MVSRDLSERQKQLAEFLKYLRSQITPEEVGFVRGPRRRIAGLRREEVAEIIGVGPDWYTWLEQGRDIRPSDEVIKRLAKAFRLNADQLAYLTRLVRPPSQLAEEQWTLVPTRLVDMIRSLEYQPAYVRNTRWDILACNSAHEKVFGASSSVSPERRNMLWLLFTDPHVRAITLNWGVVAQHVTAKFRADWSRNPEDSRSEALVRALLARSEEFSVWWRQYRTTETLTHPIELEHPVAGRITLDRVTLRPEGNPGQSVIVYMPIGAQSHSRLRRLCAGVGDTLGAIAPG